MMRTFRVLAAGSILAMAAATVGSAQALRSGFDGTSLAANDDGSTGLVGFGFTLNFFGTLYGNAYLNNNGNLTFAGPMSSYTPFPIITTGTAMIAPFFADVDTYAGALMTYGSGTVGTNAAFGVTWNGVCFYEANCANTNSFQVVLIDRSDLGAGNFDIEFNYDHIGWESGEASGSDAFGHGGSCARAGWSNGTTSSFELPGSGVCGDFLDGGPNGLVDNSFNSGGVNGRYVFNVRNGIVETTVTPEPISIALIGTGLAGIGAARRGRKRKGADD